MVLGTPMGAVRNGKISYCVRDQLPANIKVIHQKALVLMPTRTFPGIYGIELLWWHSVTNGLEEPHGVRAYDCTQEMGRFPIVYGNNCQNQSATPKTFGSYACKNISWYILYLTIMVAFRNKLSGDPHGVPNIWIYQEIAHFPVGKYREQLLKSKC